MSSTALTQSSNSQQQQQQQQQLTRTTTTTSSTSTDSLPILHLTPRRSAPPAPTPSPRTPNGAHATPNTTAGWLHPRMDEVIRRQNATNFDTSNMRAVLYSLGVMLVTFLVPHFVAGAIPHQWQQSLAPYPSYVLWAFRLLCASNALFACKPLLLTPDACEDIPLTPQQRKLLNLPPMTRPATPQEKEQYVTPPRFSRSATPRSASSSVRIGGGDSPLSGRGTPIDGNGSFRMSGGGSPYNNSAMQGSGSPYGVQVQGSEARRRLSYTSNRSSPLTVSEFEAMGNPSGSPSAGRKETRASVGLNNKWLYEKGRRGSGGGAAATGRMGVPQTPGGGRMPGMAGLY